MLLLLRLVNCRNPKSFSLVAAATSATSSIPGHDSASQLFNDYLRTSIHPTNPDIECIGKRQVFGDIDGIFAVDKMKCKHGYPQAFVRYPLGNRIASGMIRLSCPLLVKAIDEYEADGGIHLINAILVKDNTLRENFKNVNARWKAIKAKTLTDEDKTTLLTMLQREGAEAFIDSGIIGISQNKTDDIKCIHAHVADQLLSGGLY